jgi:hypothetical protein
MAASSPGAIRLYGGDSSSVSSDLASDVAQVFANSSAFAALKSDGSVVTWGYASYGGDSSSVSSDLASGVETIAQLPTEPSFDAITGFDENIAADTVLGPFATTDPDTGDTFTYALASGTGDTDNAKFTINGNELSINASPDYETQNSYSLRVRTTDSGGTSYEEVFTLAVNDLNEAPTALALENTTTSLAENTDTTSRLKVADITITDDALGTNTIALTGDDAASFEVEGTVLYLKANTTLDFETQSSYDVTVDVDDTAVGSSPDLSQNFTLTVTDVNEAPTALALENTTTSLAENTDTTTRLKVADIAITDDALGTNTIALTGDDAASFEVDAGVLYLKANTTLDFETQSSYDVTVDVDDTAVGSTPDLSQNFTLTVTDVNEAPVNTVPGAQTVNEDTALSISGLSVTDVDGNLATTQLSVTNGTLTVTLSGGATISAGANESADLTLSGTEADINATLATLSYQGNANFNGSDTLTMVSTDSDGSPLSDSDTVTIDVTAVNDAPTVGTVVANNVTQAEAGATSYSFNVEYADIDDGIDVSSLDVADITVSSGDTTLTVTNLSVDTPTDGSPRTVTYTVTPPDGSWDDADNGTYTIAVNGTQVADANGTPAYVAANASLATFTVAMDTTAPAAPSTPDMNQFSDSGEANDDNKTNDATPTFDGTAEANSTITLFSDVSGNLGTTIADSNGDWSLNVRLDPDETHIITATATDDVGNTSEPSGGLTVIIDKTAPTVTIEQSGSQTDPSTGLGITYTASFNEAVTGFIPGDITLGGTAGAKSISVGEIAPNDGTTYLLTVSGMAGHGTVIASLDADLVTDIAGNGNTASTSTDNTVQFYATSDLVINEVDYDQPGTDEAEFIELYNRGSSAIDLSQYEIRLYNGSTNEVYRTINSLSGTLAAGDYYVISGSAANVPNTDLDLATTDLIQNGDPTDAIALVSIATGGVVDALTYEGSLTANGDQYSEGSFAAADSNEVGTARTGLSRTSDGTDTQDNGTDFAIRAITPGKANTTLTDGTPSIEFASATVNASEGDGTVNITLIRTGFTDYGSTVEVSLSGGTATAGDDYTDDFPKTVTFAPGDTSQTVSLTLTNDEGYEPGAAETLTLSLGAATDATLGTQTTTAVAIADNDTEPTVTLGLAGSPLAETSGVATVTATLSNPSTQEVTVNLGLTGTATGSGTDYTASDTSIVIAPGDLSGSITLTGNDDSLDEATETVIVDIASVTNGTENSTQQVIATITDDDDPPSLTVDDVSIAEGNSDTATLDFTVSLSAVSGQTVTVNYTTADHTATTADGDYTASSGTLTFTPGDTTKTVSILVNGDGIYEDTETFYLNLSGATNATIADSQGVGTLTNDDPLPKVSLTTSSQSVDESAGTATITAELSAISSQTVTVPFTISGSSTATSGGTDYSIAPALLTIAAGSTTADLTVTLVNDAIDEGNETVIVNLGSPTNATLGTTTSHTLTIQDNDTAGFTITETNGTTSVEESGSPDTIAVVLESQPESNVEISVTSSNTNEATVSAVPALPLVFTPTNWDTPQTVTVMAVDDRVIDGDQTVSLTVSVVDASSDATYAALANQTVTVTVVDNDTAPTVDTNAGLTLDEGATGTIGQSLLAVTDAEQTAAELTYTLVSAAQVGTLFLDQNANGSYEAEIDRALGQSSTFTQADINSGKLAYRHNDSATTTDDFRFTVNDGNGGILDETTFAIAITPINDAPSFTASHPPAVAEDSGPVTVTNWASFDPGGGETGQTATYTVSNVTNPGLFSMAPIVAANGTLTFTPAADQFGTSNFTVQVQDSGGTANGGADTSIEQTFALTVNPVNDAPTFSEESMTLSYDAAPHTGRKIYAPTATDIEGDTLTYSIVSGNDQGIFAIDATTGQITVANDTLWGDPSPTSPSQIGLTVQVQDRADDSGLTDTLALTLNINGPLSTHDFNQDGLSDIHWRDAASGVNFVWYLDATVTPEDGTQLLTVAGANYVMAGVGDMDADGQEDDLVWRDTVADQTFFWYGEYTPETSGWQVTGGGQVNLQPGDYMDIKGMGDFDGDGYQDDLLWFDESSRLTSIWYIDNVQVVGGGFVAGTTTIEAGWTLAAVGNFDDDGLTDDLVWRNTNTGDNYIWLMEGITPVDSAPLLEVPTNWQLVGASDYDGDSIDNDLVWHDPGSGAVVTWSLDGTTLVGALENGVTAPAGFTPVV